MNFLAHCFLSCDKEELLVGNFMADYLRNREVAQYSPEIQAGITLHRRIDTFTDVHPEVLKGVRRLYPHHRKYAPVVIDIFYDFLLCANWHRYRSEPLPAFTQRTYGVLQRYLPLMPPRLQQHLPSMIAADWLQSYGTEEGLAYTFERLQHRVSRPEQLTGAVDSLRRDYRLLNEEFNTFFPDVVEFVACGC